MSSALDSHITCACGREQETDTLLQKMVREVFSDCTIFTIAHREAPLLLCTKPLLFTTLQPTDSLGPTLVLRLTGVVVASGLATVIDYDRIAVLDAGQLMEYGPPAELLRQPAGFLTTLVEQTGPASAAHLRATAEAAHAKSL